MNKSLKRTRTLGILFILGFIGVSWFFLLSPRLSEPDRLQTVSEEALAQKLALEAQVATLERREQFLDQAEQAAQQLEARFPWQPDVPNLIQQVQDAAGRAGMAPSQVTSVIPGKPVSEGVTVPGGQGSEGDGASDAAQQEGESDPAAAADANTQAVPLVAIMDVSISATGTYEQVSEFLRQLRLSERVIVVRQVRVAATSSDTGFTQYQVDISAHAVLLPQPPVLPGQPQEAQPAAPETGGEVVQEGDAISSAAG